MVLISMLGWLRKLLEHNSCTNFFSHSSSAVLSLLHSTWVDDYSFNFIYDLPHPVSLSLNVLSPLPLWGRCSCTCIPFIGSNTCRPWSCSFTRGLAQELNCFCNIWKPLIKKRKKKDTQKFHHPSRDVWFKAPKVHHLII